MSRALVFAIFVAACKSNAATPPPIASSAPSASASTVVEADAALATADLDASANEGGGTEGGTAVGTDSGSPLPALAKGAAWSVVRWDMSRADVEAAFEKAGVKAEPKNDVKTGAERLVVKHGAWNAVVYFTGKKPGQIVVTGEHLSKDTARAVTGKMKERAGAPTQTTERLEQRWRKAGAGATTFVVGSDGTVREEYVRDGGSGVVGFAKLTWGMPPDAVTQSLGAAGFIARVTKASAAGLDPCSMPNAPPNCASKASAQSVTITRGEQEGTTSFDDKGLTQVVISGPSSDKGSARAKELEKALGKPTSGEASTKTHYADDVAKIELEVKEKLPEGTFTVFETYRPKK